MTDRHECKNQGNQRLSGPVFHHCDVKVKSKLYSDVAHVIKRMNEKEASVFVCFKLFVFISLSLCMHLCKAGSRTFGLGWRLTIM